MRSKPEMLMPKENFEHWYIAAIQVGLYSSRRLSLSRYNLCLLDSVLEENIGSSEQLFLCYGVFD